MEFVLFRFHNSFIRNLKAKPFDLGKLLLGSLSHSSSLHSSSYPSETHLNRSSQPEKPFFRSLPLIKISCGVSKFIDHLCRQKRLKDVVQLLETQVSAPSAASYSTILQLCIDKRALDDGKRVHAHIRSSGFVPGVFISNKILDLFCKCGSVPDARKLFNEMGERNLCSWTILISGYARMGRLDEARQLFDEIPERDNFSWTAMISGYVKHKEPANALQLFRSMQKSEKSKSDKVTISSALAASAAIQSLRFGKEIHGHIMRTELDSDAVVLSALLDVYGKCGSLNEARYIFDRAEEKDIVMWTTMIDGYFGDGRWEDGLSSFSDFLHSGIKPNDYTFSSVLSACAHQTAEELGRQVHGHMMRTGFDPYSFAASSLVHMYTKCGSIERANKVFKWLPRPDLASWTSLIDGYAKHGHPHEALKLFDQLLTSKTQPDHVTFIGVLSACAHAGLVDKGLEIFYSINERHGLSHSVYHYACVVDLLSRSGRLKEAEEIISKMPMKPSRCLWASLLDGCRKHGNLELAEKAGKALFDIEPENDATYVALANIYASLGKWGEVRKMRKLMDKRGVVKKPGMSWIDVKRKVHVFLVGDENHPKSKEIF